MFTFIVKSLIITACATGGYLFAAKRSAKMVTEFMNEYINMLREEEIIQIFFSFSSSIMEVKYYVKNFILVYCHDCICNCLQCFME